MKPKKKNLLPSASAVPADRVPWIAAGILLLFAVQALWHARVKSATFDETGHIAVSHLLWTTDHRDYDTGHPPLLRYLFGLPLKLMDVPAAPDYPAPAVAESEPMSRRPPPNLYYYSAHFLFRNKFPADTILFASRFMNILLGILLGVLIFRWSRSLYGDEAGLFSLGLFALCPNVIANASIVTTDFGGAASAVFFLYSLFRLTENPSRARSLACGIFLGLALLCKFSNIFMVGIFLILFPTAMILQKKPARQIAEGLLLTAFAAWLTVCCGYQFDRVFTPHALPPEDWEHLKLGAAFQDFYRWLPLPRAFSHGLVSVLHHSGRGHSAFLLGEYSSMGWWWYFPFAFLVKTPSPVLVALLGFAALLVLRKGRLSFKESGIALGIASVLWSAMTANLNIGIRHILLIYPLLYVLLGQTVHLFPEARRLGILIAAFVFLAAEVGLSAPHYLAFFNRFSGGPSRGIQYLSDSNLDWGQDLKGLAEFLKKDGSPEVLLSYFGTAVPQFYGINFQELPSAWTYPHSTYLNSPNPTREFLAVSATNLQGTYFSQHDLYSWLLQKKPMAVIGYSIYVYDVTRDADAHAQLERIYRLMGNEPAARREAERAVEIQKSGTGTF